MEPFQISCIEIKKAAQDGAQTAVRASNGWNQLLFQVYEQQSGFITALIRRRMRSSIKPNGGASFYFLDRSSLLVEPGNTSKK